MNAFSLWFLTGFEHILDVSGYDHILFVALLTLSAAPGAWRRLLVLVTAFTAGHSVTLALSAAGIIAWPAAVVEFLIALSILAAGLFNLFTRSESRVRPAAVYTLTALFGLLHGMGFSFLLRSMLGRSEEIVLPLLYFNLGIEAAQLIIVAVIGLISLFLSAKTGWSYRVFKFSVVCFITLIALKITAERLLQLLA